MVCHCFVSDKQKFLEDIKDQPSKKLQLSNVEI